MVDKGYLRIYSQENRRILAVVSPSFSGISMDPQVMMGLFPWENPNLRWINDSFIMGNPINMDEN